MENWSFHGHIALPLEEYGRLWVGSNCRSADEIENGDLVDTMLSILTIKFGDLLEIPDFISLCEAFVDIPASGIPKVKAIEMFEEFKRLMRS